jgi:two-component system catabolic regulation response regulator CreB/two-component system response regulator ChvI
MLPWVTGLFDDEMKRILLVDDESDVCFVLEKVLGENGFVVDSYENPTLALGKFKAHSYDLAVLDIKMPDLNGFALYREIKRLDRKVKVCFLTAAQIYYDECPDIFSSLPTKCFIRKPIDNEKLMKRINEIIVDDTDSCHT